MAYTLKVGTKALWRESGLRIAVLKSPMRNGGSGGPFRIMEIGDLNPQWDQKVLLTRGECALLGLFLLVRAVFPSKPEATP
jgi:hypothetical protein